MRRDVQEIFRVTPHEKQVMMFSATLSKDIRPVCRKFMQDVSYHWDLLMFQTLSIIPLYVKDILILYWAIFVDKQMFKLLRP